MSSEHRNPWGWTRPARRLLIVVAGALAPGLALVAGDRPRDVLEVRPLVVDPNSVPAAVLGALPGIGPVKAAAIVAAREQEPFRSMADLDKRVKGIGPVTAAALKPFFRFDEPAAKP